MDNNIRFNMTFWIVVGDFPTQQQRAAAAVLAVNDAYAAERAGLRIAWVDIKDATANPNAATLRGGGNSDQFRNLIGFDQGQINVYVVDTLSGSRNMGLNFNGMPVILFGGDALTFPQVLEHELGHAFVLWHVGAPGFN